MADMRLEVVILPVSDVDRAKAFYERVGFVLDVDHQPSDDFRVVQLTPPGSSCSVTFGIGLEEVPGAPLKGLHLCVADVEEAVADLTDRGIEPDPIRHMGPDGWVDGTDPERRKYWSYSSFTDPDGNGWLLQEVGDGSNEGTVSSESP